MLSYYRMNMTEELDQQQIKLLEAASTIKRTKFLPAHFHNKRNARYLNHHYTASSKSILSMKQKNIHLTKIFQTAKFSFFLLHFRKVPHYLALSICSNVAGLFSYNKRSSKSPVSPWTANSTIILPVSPTKKSLNDS